MSRSPTICALVAVVLALAGCGGDDPTATIPATPNRSGYVALGDSFASGTGVSNIYGAKCQRSRGAYPWLLARAGEGVRTFRDQACAGTTATEVLATQTDFVQDQTHLVTLTTGGNDVGALSFIAQCARVGDADCRLASLSVLESIRTQLPSRIDAILETIRRQAPDARVLVVGYPRLFAGRACSAAGGISVVEQRLINGMSDQLDRVLAQRARIGSATFVDPRRAFRDHGVCARDPWINGVTSGGGALHPNDEGHRAGFLPIVLAASRARY